MKPKKNGLRQMIHDIIPFAESGVLRIYGDGSSGCGKGTGMDDLLIRGGLVIDGTGKAACRADVAIRDGKIAAIGDLSGSSACQTLDAEGLAVAPGFIDAHAHSDLTFLENSSGASKLYQGVTTEISGNCGSSPFPWAEQSDATSWRCASFRDFCDRFEAEGYQMAVNQAMLVGHGTLRESVMGSADHPATEEELNRMKSLLRRDLADGAWGLSLGLEYAPGCFAKEEELTALAAVVREYDGILTCHMRSEGLRIREAIRELTDIGRHSGAHVHISHLKLDHVRVHGQAPQVWALVEEARGTGVRVTADVYPYAASCTSLTIRCPRWSLDGGNPALLELLRGPRRQEVIEGIRSHYFSAERAETCLFSDDGGLWPEIVGKTLRTVAEDLLGTTDYASAAAEVLLRTQAKAWCIFFVMSEEDMMYFLSRDVSIGSDGWALSGNPAEIRTRPHPRSYGATAAFFQLAREKGLCTIEEAVCRVTGKTAECFGLTDRGTLAPGKAADITVFDPDTIAPRATWLEPVQLAAGVRHVIVNGIIALKDGVQTKMRAGRFLRK